MNRALPPSQDLRASGGREPQPQRCPRCGTGDLFLMDVVRRPAGGVAQAAYCAGVYDRDHLRFVRRSCGYCALS